MRVGIEITKKLIAITLTIGSLVFALLGFIAKEYFNIAKNVVLDVGALKTQVTVMEKNMDEDKSQWKLLQSMSKKNQEQDIKIEIIQIRVKEMSKNKWNEITVRIEGNAMNILPNESVDDILPTPKEVIPEIAPIPSPTPTYSPIPAPPLPIRSVDSIMDLDKLQKKVDSLEKGESSDDFRREQMMQQKGF